MYQSEADLMFEADNMYINTGLLLRGMIVLIAFKLLQGDSSLSVIGEVDDAVYFRHEVERDEGFWLGILHVMPTTIGTPILRCRSGSRKLRPEDNRKKQLVYKVVIHIRYDS